VLIGEILGGYQEKIMALASVCEALLNLLRIEARGHAPRLLPG
jgi:hypothetical protein